MSKKERIASTLEQLSDLCFTIQELVIEDSPGDKKDAGPSTSGLSAAAKAYESSRKGKEKVEEQAVSPVTLSEDWESVPDLVSESSTVPPTFSQVVGGSSQSVFVTPVARTKSVDSVQSEVMANVPVFANMTAAQFTAFLNGLADEQTRIQAEPAALAQGSDAVRLAVMIRREQRTAAALAVVQQQLAAQAAAQAAAPGAQLGREGPKVAAPSKFENKEREANIREWLPDLELYLANVPNADYLRFAASYLGGKPRVY